MVKLIQPSFGGGEVSPPVGARVDLARRAVAVELAENFYSTYTGSLNSRPGQAFVARAKQLGARLVEYEASRSVTYILELGNQYMRFHAQGGQVLDNGAAATISGATQANPVVVTATAHGFSNGDEVFIQSVAGMTELNGRAFKVANVAANTFELQTLGGTDVDGTAYTAYSSGGTATPPLELETPWATADLFDIIYAQSGAVLTFTHPDYSSRDLQLSGSTFTLTEIAFEPETSSPDNCLVGSNLDFTAATITGITQANPAVVTATAHGFANGEIVEITDVVGMVEVNNFRFEVANVAANTFELKDANTGADIDSTAYSAYTSGGTAVLEVRKRRYVVTAVNSDDEEESLPGFWRSLTVSNVTQADPAVVTVDDGHGLRDYDDLYISGVGGMTELNDRRYKVVSLSPTTFQLLDQSNANVDSTAFGAYTSGGTGRPLYGQIVQSADTGWDNAIDWDLVTEAQLYNIYASTSGTFGYIGSTENTFFVDDTIEPDYSVAPPLSRNPFDDPADTGELNPSVVGFFDQRRIFANTIRNENRFFMTQIGHFSNLSRRVPLQDDDAIIATIASRRINSIRHIVPLSDLIILTDGGEYRVFSSAGIITPNTINVKPQSYYGATKLRPIVAGSVGLFQTPGQFIREFSYDFAEDKFVGRDVTILARHLFDSFTLEDWDYAQAPYAVAWAIRDDGVLLSFTYMPEEDIYAWCRHTTRGSYKSVAVVREGDFDIPYFIVERKVGGETVAFIERQDERNFKTLEDAFCVDAGLSLDEPITITGYSQANPIVVTAPTHGLSNGDYVDISDIMSEADNTRGEAYSSEINGTGYTVANVTANTFELQNAGSDVDGTSFSAYSSGGKLRKAVTTVGGLWHLEGATVVAAANGYAEEGLTVTNGQVTLGERASRIHVGLSYLCRLRSLPIATYAEGGETSQSRAKNISRLTVQVYRTMGMWTGPDVNSMREAKFGLPALYGQPLDMVTEDVSTTLKGDWDKRRQVVIEQRSPLPMSILTMIPDVTGGGN